MAKELLNKYRFTKKNIISISQVFTIILVFFLFVLSDYVKFNGEMGFITEWAYWVLVCAELVLIVALMITVRSIHKNKEIELNENILSNLSFIERARKVVLSEGYTKQLDEEIIELNKENKYCAYKRKIEKKLNLVMSLKMPAKKKDKLISKYEKLLEVPKEEVLKHHVKFKKITKTGLFANIDGKIITDDEYDISAHETRDVAQMVGLKALMVFIFAGITGTMTVDFFWYGISALWGTLIKLFALLMAYTTAINQAINFVKYNVEQSLNKRVELLTNFVNKYPELKAKLIERKKEENKGGE